MVSVVSIGSVPFTVLRDYFRQMRWENVQHGPFFFSSVSPRRSRSVLTKMFTINAKQIARKNGFVSNTVKVSQTLEQAT